MTRVLLSILLCAGFFALFGLIPYRGCTGHCAGCTGSCGRHEKEGDDDVI